MHFNSGLNNSSKRHLCKSPTIGFGRFFGVFLGFFGKRLTAFFFWKTTYCLICIIINIFFKTTLTKCHVSFGHAQDVVPEIKCLKFHDYRAIISY